VTAARKKGPARVVEELCTSDSYERAGTHWHPLSVASLAREKVGEYTITVRVRDQEPRVPR